MITYLYLATAAGLFIAAQTNGEWCIVGQALTEHSLTSVVVSEGVILAGTVDGIWRSSDKGKSWNKADKHLTIPYVRWLAGSSNTPKIILAGTEPANIFVSHDGGHTWNPAFDGMQAPWPRHMMERFAQIENDLLAVLSNGELWSKQLSESKWHRFLPEIKHVKAIAANN